jgi:hypothetical protein
MVSAVKPWDRADLFFLRDGARCGMTVEVMAGFLGRSAAEVRAKAEQMNRGVTSDKDFSHPGTIERPRVAASG